MKLRGALGHAASAVAMICWSTTQALATTIPIDPRASYLLYNSPAVDAQAISLATLGLAAGNQISLTALGEFCSSAANCAGGIYTNRLVGVFSATSTLLAASILNRVQDAIPLVPNPQPIVTLATFNGDISTDIPEDFRILVNPLSTNLTIPLNANFLFIGVNDTAYGDNDNNPNNPLAVAIELASASVPEPSTLAVFAAAVLALFGFEIMRGRVRAYFTPSRPPGTHRATAFAEGPSV